MTTELTEALEPTTPGRPAGAPPARKPRRKRLRQLLIVSHRWLSLILGLVLLLITTSGALLLYRPELDHVLNKDAYSPSGGAVKISLAQAFETVEQAHPGFKPTGVVAESGIYRVYNADYEQFWSVDPSTGRILGHIGKEPTWVRWTDNLHECFLSCEGSPGYIKALDKSVPHTKWLGFDDTEVTWGSLILGVFGLVLLYLSLSGLWLWFPRPRQWRSAMTVRWKRGRFARDTDLHKVAGMIVLAPLLIWSVTGAGFELEPVENAWYAAIPGSKLPEKPDPVSTKSKDPDIGMEAAIAAAQAKFPGDDVVSIDPPAAGDPTGTYYLWLSAGFDPYGKTAYPGDRGVVVDRHTGEATAVYGAPGESTAQDLWDAWSYPAHSGYIVNGWWRLIWLILGLSPLLLAVTGISTWLVRRRSNRARRARKRDVTLQESPASTP